MKKVFLLIAVICLYLCGCTRIPDSYQFTHSLEEVASIELIYNQNPYGEGTDESNFVSIRMLEENEIAPFMKEIYGLRTERFSPPLWGYGTYIAKVIYTDGDVEMLGSLNIEYIEDGATATGVGRYFFPEDSFVEVFARYVDISQYPE